MIAEENMNLTIELLQFLGSPFTPATTSMVDRSELMELCRYSSENRMLFLYLHTVKKNHLGDFSALYEKEKLRCLKTDDAIARISQALTDVHIKHAVFKTIRPYKYTTVDLDILIFVDRNCTKSIKTLQKAGCNLVVYGPKSTTLWDQEANIGIDLYEQVAVSCVTYIDKRKLVTYVTTAKLPNGEYVKTLRPEADLACIIAHSIIKEQMYTLSEYYTFIHYLKQMNISDFLEIVKENNLTSAARTHIAITALLHKVAHETIPNELQQVLDSIGEENFEPSRVIKNSLETPHKYHPITIAKSLLEIAKGKETRKGIATQLFHMFDPNFSKDFLRQLIDHIFRETY